MYLHNSAESCRSLETAASCSLKSTKRIVARRANNESSAKPHRDRSGQLYTAGQVRRIRKQSAQCGEPPKHGEAGEPTLPPVSSSEACQACLLRSRERERASPEAGRKTEGGCANRTHRKSRVLTSNFTSLPFTLSLTLRKFVNCALCLIRGDSRPDSLHSSPHTALQARSISTRTLQLTANSALEASVLLEPNRTQPKFQVSPHHPKLESPSPCLTTPRTLSPARNLEMQTRTIVGAATILGAGALVVTQLGIQSQDRQYKKTLAYMHDGREKFQERMNSMANNVSESVGGKK